MKGFRIAAITLPVLFCLISLCGCSKESNQNAAKQTSDAVTENLRKPVDKARAAQQLGEARDQAMDEALKQK